MIEGDGDGDGCVGLSDGFGPEPGPVQHVFHGRELIGFDLTGE